MFDIPVYLYIESEAKMSQRHPVQFKQTMWELLIIAAAKKSLKEKKSITPAEYIRWVIGQHLERKI